MKIKKIIALACIVAVLAVIMVFPFSACCLKHQWSDWEYAADGEHCLVRTCLECNKKEYRTFRVAAFGFSEDGDAGHSDWAREANAEFAKLADEYCFTYESFAHGPYTDFSKLNDEYLATVDIVMFLNNIPGDDEQRAAFRRYMDNGGALMCFHASGGYYDSKPYPSEWQEWYFEDLLRTGPYGNAPRDPSDRGFLTYWNTWNPTAEPLKVETFDHFATKNLSELVDENDEFMSAPCEWYEWSNDLMNDPDTTVLLTLNPTPENPAGDDPRSGDKYESQIWEGGHHPIAWANNNYKMIYMNWGHNCQSYNDFIKESKTFSSKGEVQFMLDSMCGLATMD